MTCDARTMGDRQWDDLANEPTLVVIGSGHDPLGIVYKTDNIYFRIIHQHMETAFTDMVNIGLMNRLINENLIPKFSLREVNFEGVKRKAIFINKINSPAISEWSSAMFRDAIVAILKIVKISSEYNYTLIDGHLNNVLFHYSSPVFVDFGSFKQSNNPKFWLASGEFRTEALTPYYLVRRGYGNAVRSFFMNPNSITTNRLWIYRFPNCYRIVRILKLDSRMLKIQEQMALIGVRNFGNGIMHLADKNSNEIIKKIFYSKFTYRNRIIVFCVQLVSKFIRRKIAIKPSSLEKKLTKDRVKSPTGYWTNYYQLEPEFARLQIIKEYCKSFSIHSITDLGGNDGSFLNHLIQSNVIEGGFCLDFDEESINRGYSRANGDNQKLGFAIYNAADPLNPKGTDTFRFMSEAVISLALMHHLVIRFRVTFEEFVQQIASLGTHYAFIEFMPLGLWDGTNAPDLPEGYSEENFIQSFVKVYEILDKVVIAENRILFIGKKLLL